jgi:CheY-like chemotaxis protein
MRWLTAEPTRIVAAAFAPVLAASADGIGLVIEREFRDSLDHRQEALETAKGQLEIRIRRSEDPVTILKSHAEAFLRDQAVSPAWRAIPACFGQIVDAGHVVSYRAFDGAPRTLVEILPLAHLYDEAVRTEPTLILCDVHMEPVDGRAFLKLLRGPGLRPLATTPVIFLTADAQKDTVLFAREHQVNGYLVKPVSLTQLKTRIDSVLQGTAPG